MPPAIVELRVHDDHEVAADHQTPAETAGDHQQLDSSRGEQLLHHLPLQLRQALVEIRNTVGQRLNQSLKKESNISLTGEKSGPAISAVASSEVKNVRPL